MSLDTLALDTILADENATDKNSDDLNQDYHKGWFHTVKLTILIVKVCLVSYFTVRAFIYRRNIKQGKFDLV